MDSDVELGLERAFVAACFPNVVAESWQLAVVFAFAVASASFVVAFAVAFAVVALAFVASLAVELQAELALAASVDLG